MSVRKSDRSLISAAADASIKLERVDLEDRARRLRDEAVDMFDGVSHMLGSAVNATQAEAIEADEAHQALAEADETLEVGFGLLYDALVGTHKVARVANAGAPDDHMTDFERYLEGVNPSDFARMGRPKRIEVCRTGLDYWDEYVDDTVFDKSVRDRAQKALTTFEQAYATHRAESADATDARNRLDAIRADARNLYVAARNVAAAALRLGEVERPVGEYAVSLEKALGYRRSSDDADASSEDADEPAPAPQPGE